MIELKTYIDIKNQKSIGGPTIYDLFDISPIVIDLCMALGIKMHTYYEIHKSGFLITNMYSLTQGLYTPSRDEIGLNEYVLSGKNGRRENLDLVILHEISHWTGHSSRLSRHAITRIESGIAPQRSVEGDLIILGEELTAQAGMYGLAKILKIDTSYHKSEFENYANELVHLKDFNKKLKDADRSVEYVMNIFDQGKAA